MGNSSFFILNFVFSVRDNAIKAGIRQKQRTIPQNLTPLFSMPMKCAVVGQKDKSCFDKDLVCEVCKSDFHNFFWEKIAEGYRDSVIAQDCCRLQPQFFGRMLIYWTVGLYPCTHTLKEISCRDSVMLSYS